MKPLLFAIAAVTLATGCATMSQPKMGNPVLSKTELAPGDSTIITVSTKNRDDSIYRVEGVVMQDTRQKLPLNDDGRDPDEKAGDGIWSMRVKVPFMAPPGPYTLQISAYDANGNVVRVDDSEGNTAPLVKTCEFVIRYPDAESAPTAATPNEAPAP